MTDRRTFVTLAAGTLVLEPLDAQTQHTGKMRTLASPNWLMPARTRVFLDTLAAKFSGREWQTQQSPVQRKEDQEYRRGGDHKREVGSD
jgi:hypothetical protein